MKNYSALNRLIQRVRPLVDVKKEDGFAALHLAALNGHREVAAILLSPTGGQARIDLQNNRGQTPLHLATSQGHWTVVELLVNHHANITSVDEDGDTALHIAIAKSRHPSMNVITTTCHRDSPQLYSVRYTLLITFYKLFITNNIYQFLTHF